MKQENPIGYDSSDELVELTREQLGILQQINTKTQVGSVGSNSRSIYGLINKDLNDSFQSFTNTTKEIKESVQRQFQKFGGSSDRFNSGRSDQARDFEKSAGIGAAGVSAVNQIGSTLASSAFGLVGGAAWGATLGLYFQEAGRQAQIKSDYDRYFLNSSPNFINMANSNSTYSLTGINYADAMKMGRGIYSAAPGLRVGQEQLQNLTMQFTEGGLLYGSENVDQAVQKIKDLVGTAKKIAMLANTTLEEGGEFMQQMRKLGMTDMSQYSQIISTSNLAAGFLGTNVSNLTNSVIQSTAQMVSGTGTSGGQVAGSISNNNFIGGLLYNSLYHKENRTQEQDMAYNYINNIGVENVGAELTNMTSSIFQNNFTSTMLASVYKYNEKSGKLEYNPDALSELTGKNINQIGNMASENLKAAGGDNASAVLSFLNTSSDRAFSDMTQYQRMEFLQTMVKQVSEASGGQLSNSEILKSYVGLNDQQAALYSTYLGVDSSSFMSADAIAEVQSAYAARRAAKYGGMGQSWDSFWTSMGQMVSAPVVGISDAFTSISNSFSEGFNRWYYGPQLSGSDLITQTDFFNRDAQGKRDFLSEKEDSYQTLLSNFYELDSDKQNAIKEFGFDAEKFGSLIDETQSGAIGEGVASLSGINYDMVSAFDDLEQVQNIARAYNGSSQKDKNAIALYADPANGEASLWNLGITYDSYAESVSMGLYGNSSLSQLGLTVEDLKYVREYAKKNNMSIENALEDISTGYRDNSALIVGMKNTSSQMRDLWDDSLKYARNIAFQVNDQSGLTAIDDIADITSNWADKDVFDLSNGLSIQDRFNAPNIYYDDSGNIKGFQYQGRAYGSLADSNGLAYSKKQYSDFIAEYGEGKALEYFNQNFISPYAKDNLDASSQYLMDTWQDYLDNPEKFEGDADLRTAKVMADNNLRIKYDINGDGTEEDLAYADVLNRNLGLSDEMTKQILSNVKETNVTVAKDVANLQDMAALASAQGNDPLKAKISQDIGGIRSDVRAIAQKMEIEDEDLKNAEKTITEDNDLELVDRVSRITNGTISS